MAGVTLRPGAPEDLEAVARLQHSCPGIAQWDPADYLAYDFTVAVCEGRIAGFVVARRVGEDESEVLNVAIEPSQRRRGIGRRLLEEIKSRHPGTLFLEVRESNENARVFYKHLGFQEVAVRRAYYNSPVESAIVMKFHSC